MASNTATNPQVGSFTPEAFTERLATQRDAPSWWIERKRAAYDKFASLPLPRKTDENWRFSSISGIKLDGFDAPGSAEREQGGTGSARSRSPLLSTGALPANVIVCTLTEALAKHPDLLREHFMAQPQKLGSEKFASLHTAFVTDGVLIYVPRGIEIESPIFVSYRAGGASIFPHTLVVAEENSKVTVVDEFESTQEPGAGNQEPRLAIGANDLYAGHGAQVTYIASQNWSPTTLSFQMNSTIVRRDARVQSLNVHLGGRQSRHESLSQLQAPGAFSEMLALTVAEGAQEFDQRTLQIHQAPNTKSDLLYKNALRDKSKTIFSGLIIVDPDAQKTDAYQSNRNLMLSDDAEANSLPGLEIQANDVRCTHGATSSRIDPDQEFYLQTRGIPKATADELLTFGFFEEVLNRLADDGLHAAIRDRISAKFKK